MLKPHSDAADGVLYLPPPLAARRSHRICPQVLAERREMPDQVYEGAVLPFMCRPALTLRGIDPGMLG